jgi:tRNA threonylcarbamoyladenosine biosynthesis protein TsaB
MYLLGIETATPVCGAALTREEALLLEYRSALKNAHGRLLAPAVTRILADAGLQFSDLGAIAVSIGPGSFTGLRIGLAFAKGIAIGRDLPIVAVPTLELLAAQAPLEHGLIAPMLRSRADEYYLGLYERDGTGDRLCAETRIVRWHELPAVVPPEALLIGNSPQHPLPQGYRSAPSAFAQLSGYTVARLGWHRLQEGQRDNPDLLEPLYLQEFVVGKPKKPVFDAGAHVR